ncbi:hypothetical protein JCM19992_34540 [Thermostilla marina]
MQEAWIGRLVMCPNCKQQLLVGHPGTNIPNLPQGPLPSAPAPTPLPQAPTPHGASVGEREQESPGGVWGFIRRTFSKLTFYNFQEPGLYRVRLRGELPIRLSFILAGALIGTAIMLVLTGVSKRPGTYYTYIVTSFLLGGGLGAGFAAAISFVGPSNVSGGVFLYHNRITRQRIVGGFPIMRAEATTWYYSEIQRCTIIPPERLKKSFAVMLLEWPGGEDIIGIPKRRWKKVVEKLRAKGVVVEDGARLPERYVRPTVGWGAAVAGLGLGSVLFVGCLMFYMVQREPFKPQGPAPRQQAQANLPNVPAQMPGAGFQRAANDPRERVLEHMSELEKRAGINAKPNPEPEQEDRGPPSPRGASEGFGPGGMRGGPPIPGSGRGVGSMRQPGSVPSGRPSPSAPPTVSGRGRPPSTGVGQRLAPITEPPPGATKLVGGTGGMLYLSQPQNRPVVGFIFTEGSWAGKAALAILEPIYDHVPANERTVVAREGYVVAGLEVHADDLVRGVRVTFAKLTPEGKLDLADSYTSDWIGEPSESPETLGNTGLPVVGVIARRGAVMDALGLVLQTGAE